MCLARALLAALLQQIAVLATLDSSSYKHLVAPEGNACHANLTCYHLSDLLEQGSNWYSDTVIGFFPGNYTLSQKWVIANASQPKRNRTFYLQRKWACPTEMAPSCSKAVARIYVPFLTAVLVLRRIKPCGCLNHG